jgi:opacity protein-like surface antigen
MVGARLRLSILAAITVFAASAAQAADLSQPFAPPPPAQEFAAGWYLRGYVGAGMNPKYNIDYLPSPPNVGNGFAFDQNSNSDTFFVGGGIGYEWNSWLRFDATAEYRARTQVNARGIYDQITGQGDAYQGYIKSWVFLANTYVDLGTWNCFTPFVGAGIGAAYNQLADFVDMGIGTTGAGFGRNSGEWNFAWALHAGLAYTVSKNLKIELAYRYLNLGSVTDAVDCIGGCNADSYRFSNLYSHDIMLGLRWVCCEAPPVYSPPPLYSKG